MDSVLEGPSHPFLFWGLSVGGGGLPRPSGLERSATRPRQACGDPRIYGLVPTTSKFTHANCHRLILGQLGRDWQMVEEEKRLLEKVRGMYGSTGRSPRGNPPPPPPLLTSYSGVPIAAHVCPQGATPMLLL